jgi:hypothetical protein
MQAIILLKMPHVDLILSVGVFYGNWFDREKEWEQATLQNAENILIIYYEELKTVRSFVVFSFETLYCVM